MSDRPPHSWGHYPKTQQQSQPLRWLGDSWQAREGRETWLAYGQGRSYGDACLNDGGILLLTDALDRFIHFDPEQGLLRCESGVTLAQILALILPRGWFLPVTPGTKYVSIGGAIANDVHGKNHHRAGTFGCHISAFGLQRSNAEHLTCSTSENTELFSATIGGLGLTGFITWAEIKLKKIVGPHISQETRQFSNLEGFFNLSKESDQDWEYTMSWFDCTARGNKLGRGLFMRGNHSNTSDNIRAEAIRHPRLGMPLYAPGWLLNHFSIRAFNHLYFQRPHIPDRLTHYDPFFYPLDSIAHWNRMYGRRGFLQYQCVIPTQHAQDGIAELLKVIAHNGQGSFLAVLKQFGSIKSPGILSFPRPGTTLALDFAFHGTSTLRLLDKLDLITRDTGGAVYPAKDAHMSAASFKQYFPQWETFSQYIDPAFSSSLWRRVTQQE